jgi:hypothetical protein
LCWCRRKRIKWPCIKKIRTKTTIKWSKWRITCLPKSIFVRKSRRLSWRFYRSHRRRWWRIQSTIGWWCCYSASINSRNTRTNTWIKDITILAFITWSSASTLQTKTWTRPTHIIWFKWASWTFKACTTIGRNTELIALTFLWYITKYLILWAF